MVMSNQIVPGMTLSVGSKLFRVESSVKVTVPKGTPFMKTKLKELSTGKVSEKNFKLGQKVNDVALVERNLEFLYSEGKEHLFMDIDTLKQLLVPTSVVGKNADYLKEAVQVKGSFYGETVFSIELPQFLELMVAKTEEENAENVPVSNVTKVAILETGAEVEVPPFVEAGDVIKVDTKTGEFIQRV